jgi:hypothetical protein
MRTKILFKELLKLVESIDPESIQGLKQGYSKLTIESIIKIKPIPDSLISIYSHVDGGEITQFVPNYNLISLNKINDDICILNEVRNQIIDANKLIQSDHQYMYWEPDMIPFLDNHCGNIILVRSLPDDRSIWKMSKYDPTIQINSSMDRFLMSIIEFYIQRAYYQELDEDDELVWTTDWDLAREIVKKIDPEIEDYSPP